MKHAPHAVTMHARAFRLFRASPSPNGARCKASLVVSTILQKVRFCGSFFVLPMAETQARHLRGILRMPSQCTLACLDTIVPCHSPTWALAVRRVLLSPPISEKVRIYGSFCFPFSGDNKLFTCEACSACRHNARSRVSALSCLAIPQLGRSL